MQKLHFSIDINAPREKVWQVLWDDASYRDWTKAFSENSYAVSDWQEGSKILFLDGNGSGMSSIIAKKVPNEFMSFHHLGEVRDGKELPQNKAWGESFENYTLTEHNGSTTLLVELDTPDEYQDMFSDMFPKALTRVKELAEK